jgi:hypothetical protein
MIGSAHHLAGETPVSHPDHAPAAPEVEPKILSPQAGVAIGTLVMGLVLALVTYTFMSH